MDQLTGRQGIRDYPSWTWKKTITKNDYSLRDLLDNNKLTNICIIRVPKEEDRGAENLFEELIAENFPKNW